MPQLVRHSNGENKFENMHTSRNISIQKKGYRISVVSPTLRKNFAGEPSGFSVSIRAVWDQAEFP
jgi:hypothetical protein